MPPKTNTRTTTAPKPATNSAPGQTAKASQLADNVEALLDAAQHPQPPSIYRSLLPMAASAGALVGLANVSSVEVGAQGNSHQTLGAILSSKYRTCRCDSAALTKLECPYSNLSH